MSERVVTSLAGEEVRILDDEAWAELAGIDRTRPQGWAMATRAPSSRLAPLAVLWRDGPVEDRFSGQATGKLWDLALELDPDVPSPTRILAKPTTALFVERDVAGKRCYSIRLVALPALWLPKVEALARRRTPSTVQSSIQTRTGVTEAEVPRQTSASVKSAPQTAGVGVAREDASSDAPRPPAPAPPDVLDLARSKAAQAPQDAPGVAPASNGAQSPVRLAPEAPAAPEPALAHDVASAVATALLAQVVEVLSKGAGGPQETQLRRDLDAMAERLGTQVDYVDKLRRDARASADEVLALRQERDGLRQRLRQTEANLKAATSADSRRIIDAEVQRQLDRMMRTAPTKREAIDADLDRLTEATR